MSLDTHPLRGEVVVTARREEFAAHVVVLAVSGTRAPFGKGDEYDAADAFLGPGVCRRRREPIHGEKVHALGKVSFVRETVGDLDDAALRRKHATGFLEHLFGERFGHIVVISGASRQNLRPRSAQPPMFLDHDYAAVGGDRKDARGCLERPEEHELGAGGPIRPFSAVDCEHDVAVPEKRENAGALKFAAACVSGRPVKMAQDFYRYVRRQQLAYLVERRFIREIARLGLKQFHCCHVPFVVVRCEGKVSHQTYRLSSIMKVSDLLTDFLDYLEIEKGRAIKTRENYAFYLKRFIAFAKDPAPGAVTDDLVRQYRLWLNRQKDEHGQSLGRATQNYHLIALRMFLKYLARRDIKSLAPDKIELARQTPRQVSFLDGPELERLLEAPTNLPLRIRGKEGVTSTPDIVRLRDKAILETLFSTGLRVSELAGLRRDQLNLKKDELTVRGKGSKVRLVFLSEQARYWLGKYFSARKDVSPFAFVAHDRAAAATSRQQSADSRPLTTRSVERVLAYYAKVAGITKNVTPHTLRHSFATDLLANGADIRSVQSLLGHSSITTTQIYTHVTDTQLREVYRAFHGRKRDRRDSPLEKRG